MKGNHLVLARRMLTVVHSMKVNHLAFDETHVSGGFTEIQRLANSGYSTTVSSINFTI